MDANDSCRVLFGLEEETAMWHRCSARSVDKASQFYEFVVETVKRLVCRRISVSHARRTHVIPQHESI